MGHHLPYKQINKRICIKIYGSCKENLNQDPNFNKRTLNQDLLDCPMCVIISSCLESLESKPAICCLQQFVHYCVWLLKPNALFVEALFCCMLWQTVFKTTPEEVLSNRPKKKLKTFSSLQNQEPHMMRLSSKAYIPVLC
jgi:hypothetical protein